MTFNYIIITRASKSQSVVYNVKSLDLNMGDNTVSQGVLSAIEATVNRAVQSAVQSAVDAAMSKWLSRIETLENELTLLKQENSNLKASLDSAKAITEVQSMDLESIQERNTESQKLISKLATTTAIQSINADMYSRKWNLIIHGLNGPKGESEANTEAKVRSMGTSLLKLTTVATAPFAACHRLSQRENAGIIVKFVNLTDRNAWLAQAKELRNAPTPISISTDLPPILKPLKSAILNHRKSLEPSARKKSKVRYSKSWPYITLELPNGHHHKPEITLSDIVKKFFSPIAADEPVIFNSP